MQVEPPFAKAVVHPLGARARERAHVARVVDVGGLGLAGELRQLLAGVAAPHHQGATALAQRAAEVLEALEHELSSRPGRVPPVQEAVVEAEHGHDAVVPREGGPQRRVVVHAQIAPEPDDRRHPPDTSAPHTQDHRLRRLLGCRAMTTSPAAPPPARTTPPLFAADNRDWLRLLGGLFFGSGAVVLFIRKATETPDGGEPWGDLALLLVLLCPFVLLYGLGMAGRRADGEAEPWQSVYLVFGVLLAPFVLLQFLETIGGSTESSWNTFWIFGVTAALGIAAAVVAGATQAGTTAALAGGVSWLAFWDAVLDEPSLDTLRWLLVVFAAILVAVMLAIRASDRAPKLSGLITAAGLAAITAALLGQLGLVGGAIEESTGGLLETEGAEPSTGWDLFLFVVSVALIAFSARSARRGAGIVGVLGLLSFIIVVGSEVANRVEGDAEGSIVGWPLALLLIGVAGVVLSFVLAPGTFGGGTPAAPAPGPGGPSGGLFGGAPPAPQQPGITGPPLPGRGQQGGVGQQPPHPQSPPPAAPQHPPQTQQQPPAAPRPAPPQQPPQQPPPPPRRPQGPPPPPAPPGT